MSGQLPTRMRHIAVDKPGGPDVLVMAESPVPQPGPGDVLIRVAAAGVNRPDILQRSGSYPPPPGASPLLGLEVAGTVIATGSDAGGWKVGDNVCGLANGGGYAEYCVVPGRQCLPLPNGFDFIRAAALPETFFTVWGNVFNTQRGNLQAGESFLVHGGGSGIGTTAIQLASALGATVYTTAGSDEKCAMALKLGAKAAINYRQQDFVQEIKSLTDGKGVDVILDMVGGETVARNIASLNRDGRLVFIAFMQGSKVNVDLMPVMLKRLRITGSTLRPQTPEQKAAIASALKEKAWPLLDQGRCAPVIHATFPLEKAVDAHALMESNTHIGKIVLIVDPAQAGSA